MIRLYPLVLTVCFLATAHAEVMLCDETKQCSLICYFPNSSVGTEQVYPGSGVPVDRVRIEPVGNGNLLYTAERMDNKSTMPTYRPLETSVLPNDYPCRLAPTGAPSGLAEAGAS